VVSLRRSLSAKLLAAVSTAGLLLAPAIALSLDPLSSFTPATADPKLAASIGRRTLSLTDFKFTPAPAKGRPSQVRVAIRARATSPAQARAVETTSASVSALTPASYNLGVAVGWRRFAIAADVGQTKSENPSLGGRETAVVGVSYSLKRFTGRVAVGADRADGEALPALVESDNYSVDVGGAYNITRNIAVTGGVRYSIDHERLSPANDQRRDSQAVYVGTAFKF
jgi:hypothetical protein